MRTITTAPKRGAVSYTLHFRPDEYARVKASADRAGLTLREWLTRAVRAALDPTVIAERAVNQLIAEEIVA